ncbi:hypothetical protein HOE22_04050 [Candidatus Woesearchaeota archaeon]|nr:hypothetical protein [Candidatus Woesearchaeota archaeon]
MIRDLNKIFELWKDKVGSKRTPNPKSAEHQYQLREILNDFNWDEEVITELLYNLSEAKGKVYLKGKSAPPGAEVQTGPRGGQYYIGDPDTGEPEKPSAKKPKPKKLTKTQQAERDRIDALKIDKKLNDAETPQEEGKVLDEIVENEHQEILGGNYGPGGGAASYGEMNYSEATNGFANGEPTPLGVTPSKPTPKPEHKERYNQGNQKKKRIAYAQELGIVPYNDDDEKQREKVVNELARRETWVDGQMEKHQGTKVKDQHFKSKKDEESQREWLRVGFDGGRSTMEDLQNDPDYGGLSDNPEHPKPKSMIMSKANQEMVKGLLEKKLKACEFKETKKAKKKCETHYKEQLENFEHGLEDHDTGTVYYDKDGNLRFLNTSNKKSKSMKDPHNNSTAETRIPTVIAAMGEIADSGDYPNMDVEKVAKKVNDAQETATKMSVNASKNVMLGNDKDGNASKTPITTTQGDSSGEGSDSGGLGVVAKRLPAQKAYQNEPAYFEAAKKHKKTQAKLEELYPDTPKEDKWSDEQALVAIMELNKSGNGSWKPHGKFINKMGQMYNQVNDRFNELSPPKTEEQAYEQISKESEIEDDDGNMVPVYTPDELKEIKENDNLKEAGKLNENYKRAMANAHEEVVSGAKDSDEEYWKENGPAPVNEITGEPENGPHVRGYVKSWMAGMHWDKYIDNLDGKKNIQIGGINCKPEDFRKCLADQAGIDEEPDPKPDTEWREKLQEHLEKNIQIDADSNAVNLRGKDGNDVHELGEDTWRSAGDSKKIAGGIGDDMIECIKKSVSERKAIQRKPK